MHSKLTNILSFTPGPAPITLYLSALDVPGYWLSESFRCLRLFAAFMSLQVLLIAVGYGLRPEQSGLVVFWPAAGLLCGMLGSTPTRTWPLWLLATVAARITADLLFLDNRAIQIPLGFSLASCAEALVFAGLIRSPLQQSYLLNRPLYLLAAFAGVSLLATVSGGLLGAAVAVLNFGGAGMYWESWRVWVASDLLGIIIVAPAVGWLLLPQIRVPYGASRPADYVLLAGLLTGIWVLGTSQYGFAGAYSGAFIALLAFVLLATLTWSVFHFIYPVSSLVQLVAVTALLWSATQGSGLFMHSPVVTVEALAEMQIYLIAAILGLLLLAFALMERERALRELKLHRGAGNVLVSLTNKLIGADPEGLDASIDEVLREIAEFSEADRCILLQTDRDRLSIERTRAWTRPGAELPENLLTNSILQDFPWVMQRFRDKGFVVLEDFNRQLPEGAEELLRLQQASGGIRSVVYVGLFADDELIGAIGCSYLKPGVRWNAESLSLMYLIGQLFANVLTRKSAERVVDLHKAKLRSLAAEMAISEERARRRTAIDLHDGIGQNLAVARMKIGQLLAAANADNGELLQVRNLVDEALRGTRYIIADLSPTILYELGLYPALQSLAERFEPANDLTCVVSETGEAWEPGNDMRIALYRAVQEFLNNVARHSQAQHVQVQLEWSADKVDIEIRDDGVGFDAEQAFELSSAASGFGLFSVRESIEQLGGTLDIESARGIGTYIRLCVPRRESEDDE
jgi:signal transduction histidine kinase